MDKHDFKKIALMGICSGMMLAATSAGSVYADAHESSNGGEDAKTEKNGCSGKNGCGGAGGCGGSNGCEGKDKEGEKDE